MDEWNEQEININAYGAEVLGAAKALTEEDLSLSLRSVLDLTALSFSSRSRFISLALISSAVP
jgi:hypothetical protein